MHPLIYLMRSLRSFVGLLLIFHAGAAFALDDCTLKKALSIFVPDLDRGCPKEEGEKENPAACILLVKPENNALSVSIWKPGYYCLTEDLHARIEFADHPAESAMLYIRASDVILDLQGHTLGRGRLFKNPGGVGVLIENSQNIHIKNGVLRDFAWAIGRSTEYPLPSDVREVPVYDSKTNTYRFPITNIVIENVTFKNNKNDIRISLKEDLTP